MGRQLPDLRRKPPSRDPKRVFILFCEGKNTEPAYFKALERHCDCVVLDIQVIRAAGTPLTIAERASAEVRARHTDKGSFQLGDQIWAVFDRDDHPYFDQALKLCEKAKVGIARSTPCFEVWLILHYQDFHRPDGRHAVQRHLAALSPEYDAKSGKLPDCASLMKSLDVAERRAETQLQARETERTPFGPPSTTVHLLTRAIRRSASLDKKKK
ncbi:MAG: RloB domain-containing protein [Alphaproteobacteria bacterium]|nr:RloB domain-containing protein [Alphaproteobacteria bacterium]